MGILLSVIWLTYSMRFCCSIVNVLRRLSGDVNVLRRLSGDVYVLRRLSGDVNVCQQNVCVIEMNERSRQRNKTFFRI